MWKNWLAPAVITKLSNTKWAPGFKGLKSDILIFICHLWVCQAEFFNYYWLQLVYDNCPFCDSFELCLSASERRSPFNMHGEDSCRLQDTSLWAIVLSPRKILYYVRDKVRDVKEWDIYLGFLFTCYCI